MSCHVVSCCVMSCHGMSRHVTSLRVTSRYVAPNYFTPRYATLCYVMYAMLWYIVNSYDVVLRTIPINSEGATQTHNMLPNLPKRPLRGACMLEPKLGGAPPPKSLKNVFCVGDFPRNRHVCSEFHQNHKNQ